MLSHYAGIIIIIIIVIYHKCYQIKNKRPNQIKSVQLTICNETNKKLR